jgi:pseudaminic acid synthase
MGIYILKTSLNKNGIKLGGDYPAFIIAELSANHNQNFEIAVESVKAAKEVGADAIKLQTFTPDTITIDSKKEYFRLKEGLWSGKYLYNLYEEAFTPWEWIPKLKKIADDIGLTLFSSPFDKSSVDFLEQVGVPAYKIASLEITDIPLIKYVASKGKPVFISTGIATVLEMKEAIDACKEVGNDQIILLKCTSVYPAPLEDVNLLTIPDLAKRFDVIAGLSDHTLGIVVPVAAVSIGAKVIEKHFILDKSLGGVDADFSLDKTEFKEMVKAVRSAETALGKIDYELSEKMNISRLYRRSLFVVKDLKTGDVISEENVKSIRPGHGMSPKQLPAILGRRVKRDIKRGTPLKSNYLIDEGKL